MAADTAVAFWLVVPIGLMFLVSIPLAILIAMGAYRMRRLELYGLAMFASIAAMLPCHPGFLIGLPIGLWSLMVLLRPEVKAAFRRQQALAAAQRSIDD